MLDLLKFSRPNDDKKVNWETQSSKSHEPETNLNGLLPDVNKAILIVSEYDSKRIDKMYSYPAKKNASEAHRIANKFGYSSLGGNKTVVCPCCEIPIFNIEVPLSYQTTPTKATFAKGNKIYMLDSGTSLFFTFIKMSIAYLLLRFVITDAYNMMSSFLDGKFCSINEMLCSSTFSLFSSFNRRSSSNYIQNANSIVSILNLVAVICSIIFFLLYRRYMYEIYDLIDHNQQSQDDYTVFIENIPMFAFPNNIDPEHLTFNHEILLKQQIQAYLEQWVKQVASNDPNQVRFIEKSFYNDVIKKKKKGKQIEKQIKVRSVTLCFEMNEMQKMCELREELMEKHISSQSKGSAARNSYSAENASIEFIPKQIQLLNSEYIHLSKKFAVDESPGFYLSHFVGKAFVSFEYQHYRDLLLREHSIDKDFFQIEDVSLQFKHAAHPVDIFWYNMKVTDSDRTKSVLASFLVLLMVLIFSFIVLVLIQLIQNRSTSSQSGFVNYLITFLMPVITNIINYGLSALIVKLAELERHKTRTDYLTSILIKNVITQFLNTAVIYYILSLAQNDIAYNSFLNNDGLVIKVSSLIVISGFIQIVFNFAQIDILFRQVFNYFLYRSIENVNLFQIQLNNKTEEPEFNYAERYAYYIVQIYTISFYSYIAPITVPALLIIFAIQYWVDKFNLFKRYSSPFAIDFSLTKAALKLFEWSLLIFSIGSFIFTPYISNNSKNTIFGSISIVLSVIFVVIASLVPSYLAKKVLSPYEEIQKLSYSESLTKKKFKKTYWKTNPATMFVKQLDLNKHGAYIEEEENEQLADDEIYERREWEEMNEDEVKTYNEEQIKYIFEAALPENNQSPY